MSEAARTAILVLEPGLASKQYWRDMWLYRELFAMLAWRDISARYRQTALGVAWALVRPILTIVIFTVVFGLVARLPSDGAAPYALLVFAGMLPWNLFSTALSESSNSLVGNSSLISKVYFPRMIVPAATLVVSLIDFLLGLLIIFVVMAWYQFWPGWQVIFLPVFVFLALLVSVGPGLWFAAQNVRFRDFRVVIPFILQIGMYASPVGFSSGIVPDRWRLLYSLNPMVGVIDGFRWCLLGGDSQLYMPGVLASLGVSAVFIFLGVRKFRSTEKQFADVI